MIRDYTRIYIDGAWVQPLDGKIIDLINPATERPAGQITLCTAADVDRAVAAARKAFTSFSRSSRQERVDLLSSILGVYAKRQDDLADALTEELGAPKKFAKEVQAGVGLLHLQTAIAILKDYQFEYPQSNRTIIRREPIGVVGMITPWNWPINQLVAKVFPALATGCTIVHKPSEVAPFTAHCWPRSFMKPVCRRAYITSSMVMAPPWEPQFRVTRVSEWFRSLVQLRLGSTWPNAPRTM